MAEQAYLIKPPKHGTKGRRKDKSLYQEEIEKALWILGKNYLQLTKEEEETILNLAKRF
jgi:hypothetical protein